MSDLSNSIVEGEVGGVPTHPKAHGNDVIGHIKIGRVLDVPITKDTADKAAGAAMHACKAMVEKWKEHHPNLSIKHDGCFGGHEPTAQSVPGASKPASSPER